MMSRGQRKKKKKRFHMTTGKMYRRDIAPEWFSLATCSNPKRGTNRRFNFVSPRERSRGPPIGPSTVRFSSVSLIIILYFRILCFQALQFSHFGRHVRVPFRLTWQRNIRPTCEKSTRGNYKPFCNMRKERFIDICQAK